ncbi:ABC transporter permease [Lichenifustis flavocetrariae]|uniref:ABC transporter permease n=1 Tax=Lichenifustis flavocetrariae TaxID=2949735 RepID=UPI0024A71F3C|nr:ABC transporter permease [Lichenifustis flavocetrariae]
MSASEPHDRLWRDLKRSQRAAQLRAIGLILPLVVFLILVFIVPIGMLLSRSVSDLAVPRALPATVAALAGWTPAKEIPPQVYPALVEDIGSAPQMLFGDAAARLETGTPGMRALMMKTRSRLQGAAPSDARKALTGISPKWDTMEGWVAIKQASGPLTDHYLLTALDLHRDELGKVTRVVAYERVFLAAIGRTFGIAFTVTALALLLGFPFAFLAATSSDRVSRILLFTVLLPFWTAMLVRALSWSVLLQRTGIINDALLRLGLVREPLDLMYNRFALCIALIHIFLPYMVLPLYSVMKTIPPQHMRAAASLGARPWMAFRRVYLPQVVPGIGAGALLVFIQCLGVFVVPALLGGPNDQGLPYYIAFYVNRVLNWGLAAALSVILLLSVAVLYALYVRLSGKSAMVLG